MEKLSISFDGETIYQALEKIKDHVKYVDFSYDPTIFDKNTLLINTFRKTPVDEVVRIIIGTTYSLEVLGSHFIITKNALPAKSSTMPVPAIPSPKEVMQIDHQHKKKGTRPIDLEPSEIDHNATFNNQELAKDILEIDSLASEKEIISNITNLETPLINSFLDTQRVIVYDTIRIHDTINHTINAPINPLLAAYKWSLTSSIGAFNVIGSTTNESSPLIKSNPLGTSLYLRLGYHRKRFTYSLGLGMNTLRNQDDFESVSSGETFRIDTVSVFFQGDSTPVFITDTISVLTSDTTSLEWINDYSFFYIPIDVEMEIFSTKRFSLGLGISLGASFYISNQRTSVRDNNDIVRNKITRLLLQYGVSPRFSIHLGKGIDITLSPYYQSIIRGLWQPDSGNSNLSTIGVRFGIKYFF